MPLKAPCGRLLSPGQSPEFFCPCEAKRRPPKSTAELVLSILTHTSSAPGTDSATRSAIFRQGRADQAREQAVARARGGDSLLQLLVRASFNSHPYLLTSDERPPSNGL
jgi:hypothetical protein